jgi:threonine dehydrogenase-like Zn-dependent dehydrogenase
MRAMVFTAPGTLEMLDVDEPVAAPDETIVTMQASGICGSELHGISSPGFRQPPLIMGHEFAGTTPDGRRVVINPLVGCHECDICLRGLFYLCRNRSIVGIHRSGGFGERVAVPNANLYDIGDGLSWEQAAAIEPLANAVHAWRLGSFGTDPMRVGVIGAGTIGLVCLLVARARGAAHVAVADLSEERLAVAKRLGADAVGPTLEGEFDVIFDAVGVPATHRASVDAIRPGGTAVWLGLIGEQAEFDSQHLVRMEKRVQGSFCYSDADFRNAMALAHKVDLSWVQPFPLAEGVGIFMELMDGRTDVVKAVLVP